MLSKFFHCQWLDRCQHDWTRQVRQDLEDFNLPVDIKALEDKSEFSWKSLVKRKAKTYELNRLLKIKESKNKSKMKDLKYEKLQIQEYLTKLDVYLAKTMFRFRVRMARFSGNYKGKGPPDACPLCDLHSDEQQLSFQCPEVTMMIETSEIYENIFNTNISVNLAKTCEKIMKLRSK